MPLNSFISLQYFVTCQVTRTFRFVQVQMEDFIKMGLREVCCVCIVIQDGVSHISGVELSGSVSKESLIILLL